MHLRDVFKARGSVRADGSLRQWTKGNLYVLMEPTPTGARIRLGSRHAAAAASLRMGAVGLTIATILAIGHFFGGASADMGTISGLFAGGGLLVGNGALRLPRWARLRGRQMEDIAARLALPPGSTTIPELKAPEQD